MNIFWILHYLQQLCKVKRQDALSPMPSDAEFQYVKPQALTVSRTPMGVQAQSSRPPLCGAFSTPHGSKKRFYDPFIIKHSNTQNVGEATCFTIKRLNLSGSSCFRVFLFQHPPEPGPVGVTQKAHSGYLASTWGQIISIRAGLERQPRMEA